MLTQEFDKKYSFFFKVLQIKKRQFKQKKQTIVHADESECDKTQENAEVKIDEPAVGFQSTGLKDDLDDDIGK